ncbi:MAG: chemoreceptor glutamine deamidase CheD [Gammaproteobacteria bacterium]|nr:MAG: chemoreceptor glutamine deamidase CheD [Gammaproteobacteria bacterium]
MAMNISINKSQTQQQEIPGCLPGFEHINRFWDKVHHIYSAKILPGEYYVSVQGELISTVLGSCISACIHDPVVGIGGMNHFMLPVSKKNIKAMDKASDATRYGNYAMEKLVNEILKAGGKKQNLEVKLFGGGKVLAGLNTFDIGLQNITFIRGYVAFEELNVISSDLGDIYPRKVLYFTDTGKIKMKKLRNIHNKTISERENRYKTEINQQPIQGEIELF